VYRANDLRVWTEHACRYTPLQRLQARQQRLLLHSRKTKANVIITSTIYVYTANTIHLSLTMSTRRKLSNSRAVQMLVKLGCCCSTVSSSFSIHGDKRSSTDGHTSGDNTFLRSCTHLRDNISVGEPIDAVASVTWHAILRRKLTVSSQYDLSIG
jgi:hypothetical protein